MSYFTEDGITDVSCLVSNYVEEGRNKDEFGIGCCGRMKALAYALALEVMRDPQCLKKRDQQQLQNNIVPGSCKCNEDEVISVDCAFLRIDGYEVMVNGSIIAPAGLAQLTIFGRNGIPSNTVTATAGLAELTGTAEDSTSSASKGVETIVGLGEGTLSALTPTFTN